MKEKSLNKKFSRFIGVVLLAYLVFYSFFFYYQLRSHIIEDAFIKTQMILSEVESSQKYVREELRPTITKIVEEDDFILQAMSTTYVSRKIFKNFNQDFKEFYFKFAANNPRNTINKADKFEQKLIKDFNEDHNLKEWKGVIKRKDKSYFAYIKPIVMEDDCLNCHGKPEKAPEKLLEKYGDKGGFDRKVGEVIALSSVAIPIDIPMQVARNMTLITILLGTFGIILLYVFINRFFLKNVAGPINNLKIASSNIREGDYSLKVEPISNDEIGDLTRSFIKMAESLEMKQDEIIKNIEDLKELDELKSEFVTVASHELRSPLAVVKGTVEIMKDEILGDLNQRQKDKLEVACKNLSRIEDMLNNLLDLSKIEAKKLDLKFENVNVRIIFDSAVDEIKSRFHNIPFNIQVESMDEEIILYADQDAMIRVLVNLLDNAVKSLPDEGGLINITASRENNYIHIQVRDNGVGIAQEHLPRIFDRFYVVEPALSKKDKRTGLGLSIAKSLVEAHQGEMWVESSPNEGSVFYFTLPLK